MAFSVDEIVGDLAGAGLLRSNKFDVQFTAPIGLIGIGNTSQAVRRVTLLAESAVLPQAKFRNINEVRRYGYGNLEPKPINAVFEPIEVVFRLDAAATAWDLMYGWQNLVMGFDASQGMTTTTHNEPYGPYELSYPDRYVVEVLITAYNDRAQPALQVALRNAFPIQVGPLPLNWSQNKEYAKLPVLFAYSDYFDPRP